MGGPGLMRIDCGMQASDEDILQSTNENEYPDPESLSAYQWWQDAAHTTYRGGLGTSVTLSKTSYEPG